MQQDPKILERVRGLIAKADSTQFPAEADAFRAKADALMLRYSISEFELKDPDQQSRAIITRDIDLSWYQTNPHNDELWTIALRCATHCRVRLVGWQFTGLTVPAVGTEADLDYFDLLFTNLMLEMSNGLEPKPRTSEVMIEYLVRAKEAGMKWERIGDLMVGAGIADFPEYTRNVGVRFTKLYTDYCTEHNRPRLRVQPSVYQRSFAKGFMVEIGDRLAKIRRESAQQYDAEATGDSTAMVLADISKAVDAKTHQLFGYPRAGRSSGRRDNRKVDQGAVMDGRKAAAQVNLGNRGVGTATRALER
jgi:hypothetical protein